jgi:Ni,Fe-hydrogenase III small subunit
MLRRKEILDTLSLGAREGFFVLRLTRPDKSVRTLWRQEPTEEDLKDPSLEAVLPEAGELSELSGSLLARGMLPGLWSTGTTEITFASCVAFFDGTRTVRIPHEGYEETVRIPKADRRVVELAVRNAVKEGTLWLTTGPASLFKEDIPAGILTDAAMLNPPPEDIVPTDILPPGLPDAWAEMETTAAAIATILSQRKGKILPWVTVREALDGAFRARMLERTLDSGPWPCDWPGASAVKVRVPTEAPLPPPPPPPRPGVLTAEAELKTGEMQDLADEIANIVSAAAGLRLRFVVRVEVTSTPPPNAEIIKKINEALAKVSNKLKLD